MMVDFHVCTKQNVPYVQHDPANSLDSWIDGKSLFAKDFDVVSKDYRVLPSYPT
jgi:hypothetical protein